ncbi:MAG: hypothetical protein UX16_C0002G0022 [Parcubacteria group bacterium GW2011_GWB1_45_7]|uniref:Uncharacterized protein n=1 Tax=Candidatus Colwellbacteria bacterium RIFCSPLOWO2_02_FULL_45_11 TaxID=1797692 RepID=A0A1G1ZAE8_9BACT|nr:MAG: hypothetical protein UX16_C0002G0022 [Parcubacteria group bacterium GW2011_GWB1_45_7]OGY61618.1 MAG: hypothetical protein A3I33_00655 [Candidatus Colwellbacteria bacterium RIFCSPLOWO2_02_FULL_45_11]
MHKDALETLAREALQEIDKMAGHIIQFCGPISTGGFGNVTDNIECISSFINECQSRNIPVFNQLAYENRMDTILGENDEYDYALLEFFYKPILESKRISGLVFLPLWQTSTGSKWEHDFAKSVGIPVFYIENMLLGEVMKFYNKINH